MNYNILNPDVHSVVLYEKSPSGKACRSYDSKIIYLISGELSYTLGDGKKARMSPGNLLYIPAGELYKTERRVVQAVGERVDAIVAKVFSISRDDALSYFKRRLVFVDGRQLENNSYIPKVGERVSVRGLGRFIYLGYQTLSKKGKLNIEVDLYV